jgi:pyridoxal phosphate enzyme (YggS family)
MQANTPNSLEHAWRSVTERAEAAADGRPIRVLAVSKTQPAASIRALAGFGQRDFGENYVQEALAKQAELADCELEWHMIGPLQSNKCREVAEHFDWLQTVDRAKLVELLARHRPTVRPPLNVLIQVNIDDEASKSGCRPDEVAALADAIAEHPQLRLRGLMAIPAPAPDLVARRTSFSRMRQCYDELRDTCVSVDTLSMGMSEDFELAIAEGATMVRVGSIIFGPRRGE